MSELELTVGRTINAPAEGVFDAWLDAGMLPRFMLPMRDMPAPEVEIDPREGGRFSILMRAGEEELPHGGTYLRIDRPRELVFSWEPPSFIDGSTVTIRFEALDAGRTRVELTHVRFIDEERRDNHERGWSAVLDALDAVFQ